MAKTRNLPVLIAPQRRRPARAEPAWMSEVYDRLYTAIAAAAR